MNSLLNSNSKYNGLSSLLLYGLVLFPSLAILLAAPVSGNYFAAYFSLFLGLGLTILPLLFSEKWADTMFTLGLAILHLGVMATLPELDALKLLFVPELFVLALLAEKRKLILLAGSIITSAILTWGVYLSPLSQDYAETILGFNSLAECGMVLFAAIGTSMMAYGVYFHTVATQEKEKTRLLELERKAHFLQKDMAFAEAISRGEFNTNFDLEEEDTLGQTLLRMKESLLAAAETERRDKYVNLGLTKLNEQLRKDLEGDFATRYDTIIHFLTDYLEANQSGIFTVEAQGEHQYLELRSCVAFGHKRFLTKQIPVNEGLLGRCYLEKRIIRLTEVPEDYIKLTSGLGESLPRMILLVPLIIKDSVVGVIELASFEPLEGYKLEFLEKAAETLANELIAARNNEQTQLLLRQSQEQAEELRAQEEEMRQNMEELQATQELMELKSKETEEANLKLKKNEEVLRKAIEKAKANELQVKQQAEEMAAQEEELRQNMEELQTMQEELERKNKKLKANEEVLMKAVQKAKEKEADYLSLKLRLEEFEKNIVA